MKWTIRKYLLKVLIGILAIYISITTVKMFINPVQPIKIIKPNEQIADSKYIISEEAIMSKLRSKSQIVSMQQDLKKTDTFVDDSWAGERKTKLTIHGTYQMGLNTKEIDIKHIDSENGIIYIKLPKPILISLELPYDQIHFEKKQGFFRLAMDEKEEKTFYKAIEKNIEKEILKDKEIIKVADSMNKDAVMDLLNLLPEIKNVVFE